MDKYLILSEKLNSLNYSLSVLDKQISDNSQKSIRQHLKKAKIYILQEMASITKNIAVIIEKEEHKLSIDNEVTYTESDMALSDDELLNAVQPTENITDSEHIEPIALSQESIVETNHICETQQPEAVSTPQPEIITNNDTNNYLQDIEPQKSVNEQAESEELQIDEVIDIKEDTTQHEAPTEKQEIQEVQPHKPLSLLLFESESNNNDTVRTKTITTDSERLDIKKAFSIADKFRFQRELFNGNGEYMSSVLTEFNNMNSINDAINHITITLKWNMENPATKDFINLLRKHYK